jgi:hypothetical protein
MRHEYCYAFIYLTKFKIVFFNFILSSKRRREMEQHSAVRNPGSTQHRRLAWLSPARAQLLWCDLVCLFP